MFTRIDAAIGLAVFSTFILVQASSASSCQFGSSLPFTSPFEDELGHYLDLDQTAPCSGTLVAWNYCYYPSNRTLLPDVDTFITFLVWRPISPNRFSSVSGQRFRFTSPPPADVPQCSTINLTAINNQFEIQQGDVYAVYLEPGVNTLAILSVLEPMAAGRRLYMDQRTSSTVSTLDLRIIDTVAVDNIGIHLSADIEQIVTEEPTTDPPPATTDPPPATTDPPPATTGLPPTTEPIVTTATEPRIVTSEVLTQTSTEPNQDGADDGGAPILVIVFILLLLATIVVLSVVGVVCFRKRLSIMRYFKERNNGLGELGNALYRAGSQIVSKLPNQNGNTTINVYDRSNDKKIPESPQSPTTSLNTHRDSFAVYSIPTSTPVIQNGHINHNIETQVTIEPLQENYSHQTLPYQIKTESPPQIVIQTDTPSSLYQDTPSNQSQPCQISIDTPSHRLPPYQAPTDTPSHHQMSLPVHKSPPYQVPTNIPSQQSPPYQVPTGGMGGMPSHLSPYQVPTGYPIVNSTGEQNEYSESGDYIYMGTPDVTDEDEPDTTDHEDYTGPEKYQEKMGYDSVQYRSMLQQATVDTNEENSPYKAPPSNEEEIYVFISQQKIKVIPRQAIQVSGNIGSGHFGAVDKGVWESTKKNTKLDVALKSISENGSTEDKIKLLQEAITMSQFTHPNIVQLYGILAQSDDNPLIIVMEFMPKGDLKKCLLQLKPQKSNPIDPKTPNLLLSFSEQVALGMHYLASKRLVHRDLAARNILVSEDNTCKIGDFGMSRNINENGYYVGNDGKVPIKWTAPEAIKLKKYSTASDVWSYGCLLYEIWTLGAKLFKGMKNNEAIEKINSGYRLPPPPGCPKAMFSLMIQCWHPISSSRPKYQSILTSLLQDPKKVLQIPLTDASSHSSACLLGSSLESGLGMYTELQCMYIISDADDRRDPDYEYMYQDVESDS